MLALRERIAYFVAAALLGVAYYVTAALLGAAYFVTAALLGAAATLILTISIFSSSKQFLGYWQHVNKVERS